MDPRAISKNIDLLGRSQTASDISEARAVSQYTKQNIDQEAANTAALDRQIELSQQEEAQLQEELTQQSNKLLVKLKGLIGIKDQQVSRAESLLNDIAEERQDLTTQLELSKSELERLQALQAEIPTARQLLDAYYEKVLDQPLSNEQKRELLKPEVLASLSTEEYIALWRRLNPYFLSHVTRQGFRDHNAMVYHSGGMQEFHNGFTNVIADGKMLRPSVVVEGLRSRDEEGVKKILRRLGSTG